MKLKNLIPLAACLILSGCVVGAAVDLAATTVVTAGKLAVKGTGAVINAAIPDGDDKKKKDKKKQEKASNPKRSRHRLRHIPPRKPPPPILATSRLTPTATSSKNGMRRNRKIKGLPIPERPSEKFSDGLFCRRIPSPYPTSSAL